MNETLHACQERFRTAFVMNFDLYRYSHGDLDSILSHIDGILI